MKIVTSVLVTVVVVVGSALSQSVPTLTLDGTKPYVYIAFDHIAPRPPVEDGEPPRGIWLRLENNSIFPIEVQVMDTSTEPTLTLVPVEIVPRMVRIERSNVAHTKMPSGYGMGGAVAVIAPGKNLAFSVPTSYVATSWYMRVPFRLKPSAGEEGIEPECFAVFTLEAIPAEQRKSVRW